MRVPALPIIASFALLAAPAFAQSSSTTGATPEQTGVSSPSTTTTGSTTEQTGISSPSTAWQHNASVTTDTRQKIAQSLEQSGFKDIRVTPEAFVIHAQAPDGSRVVMMLRPDGMTGVIEQTGSSAEPNGSSAEPNGSSSEPNGSSSEPNGSMPSGSSSSEGGVSH